MSEHFQVVFTGKLKPGKDADDVIRVFSEKFKIEPSKAALLIRSNRPVIVKKGLELDKAYKYQVVLQHLGMLVELSPKPPKAVSGKPPASQPAEPQPVVSGPSVSAPSVSGGSAPQPAPDAKPVGDSAVAESTRTGSKLALEPLDNGGDDTTEVLDSHSEIPQCPKCGSRNMELGICQDCGIVAAKYQAAHTHDEDEMAVSAKDRSPPTGSTESSGGRSSALALEALDHGGDDDTTEMLDSQMVIHKCPKCGSEHMEVGICLDCGIVASKYLAAQSRQAEERRDDGAERDADPYSAPEADLEQPYEGEMGDPQTVPALNGLAWLGQGWDYFKSSPLGWLLSLVVWFVLSIVVSLVPFVGPVAVVLLGPVITGGLMVGCSAQEQGDDFSVSHLFAGFSRNPGQLVLVGLLMFVMMILTFVVMSAIMSITFGNMMVLADPQAIASMMGSFGFVLIVILLLFLTLTSLIMMAYLFAPPLVALDGVNSIEAMKLSFMGCLKNLLPLTVYGIAAIGISIVLMIPVFLGVFGIIPAWLGVLLNMLCMVMLFPVFTASVYSAYRDIYFTS